MHLSCVLFICLCATIWNAIPTLGGAQCPVTSNFTDLCTCDRWQLSCSQLGHLDQFPPLFVPEDRIFSNVTVDKSGIRIVQTRAFGAIRTREIFLIGIGLEVIEEEAFAPQQDTLEALYLSNNNIRIIKPRALAYLTRLIRLKLDNNKLFELDEAAFSGLSSLRNLYLHNNALKSLPSKVFPAGLDTLTLYRNQLEALYPGVFNQRNLTLLNLRENKLANISDAVFNDLPSLANLDLSWNKLTSVGKDLFAKNFRLRHLDLAINQIVVIHPSAFRTLSNLEYLDLSDNNLQSIPGPLFGNLTNLRTLYLSSNLLSSLPDQMSSGMRNLRTLYLQSNRLDLVGRTPLHDLVLLETLRLDHNRIHGIDLGAFDLLGKLRHLDLSDNVLDTLFDDPFKTSTDLEWVDLSYNQLRAIPSSYFRKLDRIQFIDLSNNRIQNLSRDSFASQIEMTHLNLSHNWIQTLGSKVFHANGNVTFLSLASNPLLDLDPDAFRGLASLDTLFMNDTCLTELPSELFQDATVLRRIHLENGRIQAVANNTFSDLSKLRYLDLSHNLIQNIESGAFSMPNIQTLKLSHNNIDIYGLRAATALFSPTVIHLDVSYNNVTRLTGITPKLFEAIDEVLFAGNPFTCDCDSHTFWIRSLQTLQDFETTGCSSPPSRLNVKVVCFEAPCQNDSNSSYPFQASCDRSPLIDKRAAVTAGAVVSDSRTQPDVCDMRRYTPTAKTTTTPVTAAIPAAIPAADMSISVRLRPVSLRGTPGIVVTWNVSQSLRNISNGYVIMAKTTGSGRPPVYVMDPESRNHTLTNLDPLTNFRICVRALLRVRNVGIADNDCADVRTSASTSVEKSVTLILVLAVVSVVTLIVIVLIIAGLCLRRQRKRTGPKEVGKKISTTSLSTSPQAWVQAPDVTLVGDCSDIARRNSVKDEKGANHVNEMTDIWMDDDGEINLGTEFWEEGHVTGLSQSLPAVDLQKDKAKRKNSAASAPKRSNSTLANAGRWVASFNNTRTGDGGAPIGEEEMGEQTTLSLNIFDCKNSSRLDGSHPGFGN